MLSYCFVAYSVPRKKGKKHENYATCVAMGYPQLHTPFLIKFLGVFDAAVITAPGSE